jgi:hypothetical protein
MNELKVHLQQALLACVSRAGPSVVSPANWGWIAARSASISGIQNRPFRSPAPKEIPIQNQPLCTPARRRADQVCASRGGSKLIWRLSRVCRHSGSIRIWSSSGSLPAVIIQCNGSCRICERRCLCPSAAWKSSPNRKCRWILAKGRGSSKMQSADGHIYSGWC